jgi:O-antigen ligase
MHKLLDGNTHVNIVRVLIMVGMTAMLVSTAAAVGLEVGIYLLFILSGELRRRFMASFKQPMVLLIMVFYAMLTIGLFYGLAPWEQGVHVWSKWRKLLLVPLAVAVFDDPTWKRRLAVSLIGFAALAAIVSVVSYLFDQPVYYRYPVGIVLTNHSTQSMVFALAIFTAGILMRCFPISRKGFWLAVLGTALITGHLIFINTGRSGYLALLVLLTVGIAVFVPGKIRFVLILLLPFVVGMLLMASPVARQRIVLGFSEIVNLDQSEAYTSMGIRMVIYKNSMKILKDPGYPLLTGHGTGGFQEAYRPHAVQETGWKAEVVDDGHNQYLSILIEHGVAGLLLFCGFIVACFRQAVTLPFKVLGVGALLAWCATSLLSLHFSTALEGRLIFIWLGAMLAMPAMPFKRDAVSETDTQPASNRQMATSAAPTAN